MSEISEHLRDAFERVAIDDDGRACRDIPDSACKEEPRNFFTHVASLAASKTADGLIDPKLVLSWLITALGAPSSMVGFLVPVREAGALLPQLFTAAYLRQLPRRKWAWSAGAAIQGVSALSIAVSALTLEGAGAGWAIIGSLTVLAIARSVCSVCYKDVLGKTVAKSRRGSATGLAGSLAAVGVIIFAVVLSLDLFERMPVIIAGLTIAGALWIGAASLFATLKEAGGASDGGVSGFDAAMENFGLLKSDKQLRRFIATRGALTATALAPPFMIAAASEKASASYGALGFLLLASAGASLVSSYVWGRLADRSSRKVLMLSGAAAALALVGAVICSVFDVLNETAILPALLFFLMVSYQGVRLGRSTHLVDMATAETRAAYTALSNTIIGFILLAGGALSLVASLFGATTVIGLLAVFSMIGGLIAMTLDEVQET
ncbi:MAG: MFS transporter [Pseudomonadota bacterium]